MSSCQRNKLREILNIQRVEFQNPLQKFSSKIINSTTKKSQYTISICAKCTCTRSGKLATYAGFECCVWQHFRAHFGRRRDAVQFGPDRSRGRLRPGRVSNFPRKTRVVRELRRPENVGKFVAPIQPRSIPGRFQMLRHGNF